MTPGVCKSLVGSVVFAALIAVAGCSHYMLAERDSWRHDAEESCINSGVPQEVPGRVRISSISGPGACGIDYPLKVSELGVSGPLGYDDEPMQPPGSIPNAGQTGRLPPWFLYNGSIKYSFDSGAAIQVTANNLRNSKPPVDRTASSFPYYNTYNYNPYGRVVWVEFAYRFGGSKE